MLLAVAAFSAVFALLDLDELAQQRQESWSTLVGVALLAAALAAQLSRSERRIAI